MSREFYFKGIDNLLRHSGSETDKLLVSIKIAAKETYFIINDLKRESFNGEVLK